MRQAKLAFHLPLLVPAAGIEPTSGGLGNRCLIHLATRAPGQNYTKVQQEPQP